MYTTDFDSDFSVPALYVHIPFCKKVCPFCSFAVMKDNPLQHSTYLDLIKEEFQQIVTRRPLDFSPLESVYIGGGTPSRLRLGNLERLVTWIKLHLATKERVEWSIEVNPEDITEEYAKGLAELGFNRISLGVQSFSDNQLKRLRRQHTGDQVRLALENLHSNELENINIDLMFGYPGQTLESLKADLHEAQTYKPKHVSVYSLTIEPKTALHRRADWKNWIRDNDALIVQMYRVIIDMLALTGINQYEVSNFCQTGFESRQNMVYWRNLHYLGLGVGAHSHCFSHRWGNCRRLVDYKLHLKTGKQPFESYENITQVMRRDEDLMLGLRLKKGINLNRFYQKHQLIPAKKWLQLIDGYRENRLVQDCVSHLKLTTSGMLLADEISASLAAACT